MTDIKVGRGAPRDSVLRTLRSAVSGDATSRSRIIVQAYEEGDWRYARKLGFENIVYSLYHQNPEELSDAIAFAAENNIRFVALPRKFVTEDLVQAGEAQAHLGGCLYREQRVRAFAIRAAGGHPLLLGLPAPVAGLGGQTVAGVRPPWTTVSRMTARPAPVHRSSCATGGSLQAERNSDRHDVSANISRRAVITSRAWLPAVQVGLVAVLLCASGCTPQAASSPARMPVPVSRVATDQPSVEMTPTTFAVIGDYGQGRAQERAVAKLVASWNPGFVITTGRQLHHRIGRQRHRPVRSVHGRLLRRVAQGHLDDRATLAGGLGTRERLLPRAREP